MKVAILNIDENLGGASIACSRLVNAFKRFSKDDFEVDFFVQDSQSSISNNIKIPFFNKVRFALDRLSFVPYAKDKSVRFSFSRGSVGISNLWLKKLKQYDIIHIHWFSFGFLSLENLSYIKSLGKPVVFTLHDMWLFTGGCHYSKECTHFQLVCGNCKEFLKAPSNDDLSRRVWKNKQALFSNWDQLTIVGCSEWIAQEARKSSLLKGKNIVSIPNTLDQKTFSPTENELDREKLGLKEDSPVVLFSAMNVNDSRKGGDLLINSIKLLHEQNLSFQVLIVGKETNSLLNQIPVPVIFTGFVKSETEMASLYNSADVFAIPSRQDNLPNSVVEALSCGTPCVGFNIGGIPEMIKHMETGYVAQKESVIDFAEGLRWVLLHKNKKEVKRGALKSALKDYSNEVVSKQHVDLYKSIKA